MKKISAIILLGLCILISSCNKEKITNTTLNQKSQNNGHFYGVKTPEQTRGVAQIKKLWYPGTTIDIKFLNGSEQFQQKVKTYAAQWEQYANINFNFVEQGDADVRITFDANNSRYVTWSTIGTDCKMITDQSEPTMNFVDWRYSLEKEIKGDVLRAFGQVLGLELEHRQTDFDAGWRDNISLYWEGSLSDIPWEELKKYVFDPLEKTKILETDEYDENSIMIWPFPRQFALNTARDYNFELSEKDIEFVSKVYPKEKISGKIIATIKPHLKNYSLTLSNIEVITVDWGDGTYETLNPENNKTINHVYPDNFDYNYIINIYGESHSLEMLKCTSYGIDVSACTELKYLNIFGTDTYRDDFENLDFSTNIKLQELGISNLKMVTLDVTNNAELQGLFLYNITTLETINFKEDNLIELIQVNVCPVINSLDLSDCKKLRDLWCDFNKNLETINLSNCKYLTYLSCIENNLSVLDLTENIHLSNLYCSGNKILELDLTNKLELGILECVDNQLTTLNLSHAIYLTKLNCMGNNLSELDLSFCKDLIELSCSVNSITNLDVSNCIYLTHLRCDINPYLQTINIIGLNDLKDIYCYMCDLSTLDVSGCTSIESIECYDNPFVTDQNSFTNFANSLPDRTGNTSGQLDYENSYPSESVSWITDIIAEKNWNFK